MITRMYHCDMCGFKQEEDAQRYGYGLPNWSQFQGIKLNGSEHPFFCPKCTAKIASMVDTMVANHTGKES